MHGTRDKHSQLNKQKQRILSRSIIKRDSTIKNLASDTVVSFFNLFSIKPFELRIISHLSKSLCPYTLSPECPRESG